MSYLGSSPTTQSFIAGTDQFTGNGSSTNWTLSRAVTSVNDIEIVIANVEQNPISYSVSGTTLTISPAVGNGTVFYVRYLSTTIQTISPSQGTVQPSSLSTGGPSWDVSSNLTVSGQLTTTKQIITNAGMYLNKLTISTTYAIPSGYSAMSAGNITIATGVTVTVPSGSRWVVV